MSRVSVIIPAFNESEETLGKTVDSFSGASEHVAEIIIVEAVSAPSGHPPDYPLQISSTFINNPKVRTVKSYIRSRAVQMNIGAKEATGDVLLFVHADSQVSGRCVCDGLCALDEDGTAVISFSLRFDSERMSLRIIEHLVRVRNFFFTLPFGDQCYMVSRERFFEVGGFDEVPILEDVKLIEKLKRKGRVRILPAHVTTSARRYEERGVFSTYIRHLTIMLLYWLGVSTESLSKMR